MKPIRKELYTHLAASAAVAALVADRVYPSLAPQGTPRPYLVLTSITDLAEAHMAGPGDVGESLWQIDCYADTPEDADSLALAVDDALDGFHGAIAGRPIFAAFRESGRDAPEGPTDGSEFAIARRILEYRFWHRETVPS